MKKLYLMLSAITVAAACADAGVSIKFTEQQPAGTSLTMTQIPLFDLMTAKRQSDLRLRIDTLTLENEQAHYVMSLKEPSTLSLASNDNPEPIIEFFASPEDNLTVTITGVSPEGYNVSITGSQLMEGITAIRKSARPYEQQIRQARQNPKEGELDRIFENYEKVFTDYINANPSNPASAYAMLNLSEDNFMEYYAKLEEGARESILYPMVEKTKSTVEKSIEAQQKQQALENGSTAAPDFKLPDIKGTETSLSDFRGKWVILDFWGSWCGWCIKGFPELKEAYAKYNDKLEILGIDCGDTKETWVSAVEKYSLPWVNLYNDMNNIPENRIDEIYGIQGFPTKIIISPEGIIKKIVTGEDPAFYDYLSSYLD